MSKFSLIDLAGSERITEAEKNPERIDEARFINKSLSALGNVVAALRTQAKRADLLDQSITSPHLAKSGRCADDKRSSFHQSSGNQTLNFGGTQTAKSKRSSFHRTGAGNATLPPVTFSEMSK